MISGNLRRLLVLLGACAIAGAVASAAVAYWSGAGEHLGSGEGAAAATSVNPGAVPTVSANGSSNVVVSWSASTLANGEPVDGYLVRRYDATTEVAATVLSSCAGTVTATSCEEARVPTGNWKYTVTPVVGNNWRGTESAKSAAIQTSTPAADFLQPITSPEPARAGPAALASGDVDNDGDADIVMANLFEAAASVLVNNGVGEFSERTVIANAATVDVGLGNFDNDGNLDLVLLYPQTPPAAGLLIIFKGEGDGNFTFVNATNEIVATGVRPTALAVGNFNGDAIDDVAVVNSQSNPDAEAGTVTTFLGGGGDGFASSTAAQTLNVGVGATDVGFADFNGGAKDLVVTNYASNSVSFMSGNGTGFDAPTSIAAGGPVFYLDTGNLNAGSNRDIVATLRASNPSAVRTLYGNGAGGFPTQGTVAAATAGTGDTPQRIVANDLDGDADTDVALANAAPETVSVLENDGAGGYSIAPSSPETGLGAPGTVPFGIASADFDGSGFDDLAVSVVFTAPGQVPILLNQSGDRADLSITQSASPEPVNAGSDLTYTLTVSNGSSNTPSSVKATDTLPAGVTFKAGASSASCSATGGSPAAVTCDYGSVAPGSPETRQVVVTTGAATPASIVNTATVAGNLADPTPANNTSSETTPVNVDTQPPTHSISLTDATGAFLSGSTLYYKGNAAGSFKLVDALADSGTGPASVTYPSIATTGWTHGAETVTTPSGGPYASATYSWTASPANPSGYAVNGADSAGNTSSSALTFASDTTAPASGSVTYTNGMVYTTSVPVTTADGTDAQSGIDSGSGIVTRAEATLNISTQTCGTFGSFSTTVNLVGGADTSVSTGKCYQYRYLVSDRVGNQATYTSSSVAKVDTTAYNAAVSATTGLVNYWRLGESLISSDTFTGTAGTLLSAHTGELGANWAGFGSTQTTAVLTDANRVRRNGVGTAMYSASGVPPTPDYSVEADVTVRSLLTQDSVNVLGRIGTSGDNFYLGRWQVNGAGTGAWALYKVVNNVPTQLGVSTAATLTAGQTYRVELRMVGSTISLWVGGSQLTSATDTAFTAAGKAGLRLGFTNATPAPTNTTGLHVDNFRVTPAAADDKGTNEGTYRNEPTLGVGGAISGSSNTAVSFDGNNDYVSVNRQIQDDMSIEFWFKSTQGLNTNAQWWGNAGLVDAEVGGAANDFGVSLRSDGRVVAGVGTPDVSIVSSSGGYNDDNWHHVVFTRNRTTGALALYVDGSSAGTATGSTASLTAPASINFGRIATGGNYYQGRLDEVAVYSSVLSQATVSDHYNRR